MLYLMIFTGLIKKKMKKVVRTIRNQKTQSRGRKVKVVNLEKRRNAKEVEVDLEKHCKLTQLDFMFFPFEI